MFTHVTSKIKHTIIREGFRAQEHKVAVDALLMGAAQLDAVQ